MSEAGPRPAEREHFSRRRPLARVLRAGLAFLLGVVLLVSLLALIAAAGGLISAPAVLPASDPDWTLAESGYPPGTTSVEIPLPTGEVLRGIHVPSDRGAPLVVHFAEGGISISTQAGRRYPFTKLSDLGFASLFVDYRGVGRSDGECSPDSIIADAQAVYAHALERVGGDERRLVLRGASLGTLAAGGLLERGAGAAAIVLHAPIFGQTVVRRMGQAHVPDGLAWIAASVYRPVTEVDLLDVLATHGERVLVFAPEFDELLSTAERAALGQVTLAAGGRVGAPSASPHHPFLWSRRKLSGHFAATFGAYQVRAEESEFLLHQFPGVPDVPQRIAKVMAAAPSELKDELAVDPAASRRLEQLVSDHFYAPAAPLVALALCIEDGTIASKLIAEEFVPGTKQVFSDLTTAELLANLDLSDPAGPLPASALFEARHALRRLKSHTDGPRRDAWPVADVLRLARVLNSPEPEQFDERRIELGETRSIPQGGIRLIPQEEVEAWMRQREDRRVEILTMDLEPQALIFSPSALGLTRMEYLEESENRFRDGYHDVVFRTGTFRASLDQEAALSSEDRERRTLRLLLKAVGYSDRVVVDRDGSCHIELLRGGVWAPLDLGDLGDLGVSSSAPTRER